MFQCKAARTSTGAPEKGPVSPETIKTTSPESKVPRGSKRAAGEGKSKGSRGGKKAKRKEVKEEEEEKPVVSGGQRPKNTKRRSVASKVSYKEESHSEGDEEELSDGEEFEANSEDDSEDSETGAKKEQRRKGKRKAKDSSDRNTVAPKRKSGSEKQVKDEEEAEWVELKKEDEDERVTTNGTKRRSMKKKDGPGTDEWLEVYLEKTSSWVCVDVEHGVGMPLLCSQNATAPVTYVLAVDGNGCLKDLGRKYDPTWMTSSRKRRVDDEWWEETLLPFLGPEDEKDIKEEKEVS